MEIASPTENPLIKGLNAHMIIDTQREDLDELFCGSPVGEIPVGRTTGTALAATGSIFGRLIASMVRLLAWKGKVFNHETSDLKNLIGPFGMPGIRASVYKDTCWFDGREGIILDYSNTSFIAQKIRDEMREIAPGLYLGQVYWGRKRILGFMLEAGPEAEPKV